MKQFVVLLVFLVSFLGLKAQVYPVNVNITTAGQNMPYLSYYGDQNQHLNIFLLLTDFNSGAVDVRLKVKLEGPGFRFETSPTAIILPSFNLQPGQPKILTGDDILPYLLEENLVQTSGNGSVNLQKLPEGSYTLCIDVIKDNINADILSTNNCKGLFINTIQPPLLNSPLNQDQVDTTATLLSFNWTQPYNYYGATGLQVNYSWYLYEWVDTTNYNIFFTNQGLIYNTEEIITSKLLSIPSDVYLQNGYHYVWRVRAWFKDLVTGQELDIITNNGYSEPYSFRYGKPVSLLENLAGGLKINLNASALGERKGKALWTIVDESPGEGVSDYTSYIIEYRRKPQEGENYPFDWNADTVYQKNFDIYQLEPEKTYQVRVSGRLNDYQSPPSDVAEFTTPARTVFACNDINPPSIPENFQPLETAYMGQFWQLGQFEMEIIEANKTVLPGRFSGRGLIRHDFLNGARCFVRFTDILVDKEFVVREGEAQAITDGATNWANNLYLNMVTPYNAGGVITSYGWINDSTAFVVVDGVTIPYSFTDPNLPIVVHGEGNVEIQFWPDGTIVVTTYGTQPSNDSLNATANFNVQFKSVEDEEAFYDKKQYDHFAINYELIPCQDGYNYWVDNVSKKNTQTKSVIATVHADVNGYTANDVSFGIKGGATLVSTPINDTTFNVELPSRSYSYQIYAYYDSLKLGKLNVVTLEVKERVVHLVPLQAMTLSEQSIENTLNTTFAAAQMNLDVVIDSVYSSSTFNGSTTFSNPEVDGMQHYTAQMKALRDEYIGNHTIPSDDYLVFIVPSFTDQNIDGYMVRGKGLGFLKNSSTLSSFTTTLAHELGHGIGGLSHTWGDNLSKKGTTDNLLDYNGGTKLIKNQWKAINESPNVISLFDGEEDGSSINVDISNLIPFKNSNETYTFFAPNGRFFSLPSSIQKVEFSTLDRWGIDSQTDYYAPLGSLLSFKLSNGDQYGFLDDSYYKLESSTNNILNFNTSLPAYIDNITSQLQPTSAITCFFDAVDPIEPGSNYIVPILFRAFSGINQTTYNENQKFPLIDKLVVFETSTNDRTKNRLDYVNTYKDPNYNPISVVLPYHNQNQEIILNVKETANDLVSKPFHSIELVDLNLGPNSSVNDLLKYFLIVTSKSHEFAGLVDCIESMNQQDLYVLESSIREKFNIEVFMNSSKLSDVKNNLDDFKVKTINELYVEALKIYNAAVLADLNGQIVNGNAQQIAYWIDNHDKCILSGLSPENRAIAFKKLISNQNYWHALEPLLDNISKDLASNRTLFLEKTVAYSGNLEWIQIAFNQLNDYNGDETDLTNLFKALIHLNKIISENTGNSLVSESRWTREIVDNTNNWKTFGFDYGTTDETIFVSKSWTQGEVYLNSRRFNVQYPNQASSFSATFNGSNIIVTNYAVLTETSLSINSPNSAAYTFENSISFSLKPYELVKIAFTEDYLELGISEGEIKVVPAYFLLLITSSNANATFWNNVNVTTDLLFIALDAVTFYKGPFTFTGALSGANAALQAINFQVNQQKVGMNATELEQFSTWDKFFAIANIATLTPAVASIANKFAHASLAVYDAKKLLQKLDNVNASSIQALQSLKNSIKSLLGVNVAGNTQFSKNAIASINGFSDNISNLAVQNGIDLNTFKNIQKEAFVNLTTQEKIIINNLRNNIPSPDANTILQKAIPKSEFNDYLSGYRNQVGGYITTAKDAKHLNTFDEIYYGMRLDYSGTKFSINDGSCGVIRYKTSNVSSIEVPRSPANGGSISDLMPFTGHGFTSAENGLLGVPEWKSGYLTPNEGAELWEVFSDGTEILIATFSTSLNKFILVP